MTFLVETEIPNDKTIQILTTQIECFTKKNQNQFGGLFATLLDQQLEAFNRGGEKEYLSSAKFRKKDSLRVNGLMDAMRDTLEQMQNNFNLLEANFNT